MKQLGDILVEGGLVTQSQLATAFEEHQRLGRSLGRVLVDQGVVTEGQLVAALATQIGSPERHAHRPLRCGSHLR